MVDESRDSHMRGARLAFKNIFTSGLLRYYLDRFKSAPCDTTRCFFWGLSPLMQTKKDDPHDIHTMLVKRLGHRADASRIAAFAVSIWHEVEATLAPMFEESGVAAIYRKSLEMAAAHHPCLADAHESEFSPGKFANLGSVLLAQKSEHAWAMLVALLNNFHDLMIGMFSGSMVERMLRSIWDKHVDAGALSIEPRLS